MQAFLSPEWTPLPPPFFSADLIFCKVHTFHLNSQDIQTWAQLQPLTKVERRSSVTVVIAEEGFSVGEVSDQGAQALTTPVHHHLQAEQTARAWEMGGSEGSSQKVRAIWSNLRKARNCYSAAPQLQADQHHPPVQRSDPPPCKVLGILSFPAPGGWERKTFPPILWILSSQWTAAHYMQCSNGGKIPLVFGKELNAPSLLPGPMEKRWVGAAKLVTQSSQTHQQIKDIPPHTKGDSCLFSRECSISRQSGDLTRTAGGGLAT